MPNTPATSTPAIPDDAAERSIEAGIADETAAYEQAIETDDDESAGDRT